MKGILLPFNVNNGADFREKSKKYKYQEHSGLTRFERVSRYSKLSLKSTNKILKEKNRMLKQQ